MGKRYSLRLVRFCRRRLTGPPNQIDLSSDARIQSFACRGKDSAPRQRSPIPSPHSTKPYRKSLTYFSFHGILYAQTKEIPELTEKCGIDHVNRYYLNQRRLVWAGKPTQTVFMFGFPSLLTAYGGISNEKEKSLAYCPGSCGHPHLHRQCVYAWSVLTKPVMAAMGLSLSETTWAFSIAILALGLSAGFLGGVVERMGPSRSGLVSAAFFGTGLLGTALAVHVHLPMLLYIFYGTHRRHRLGTGYITPVSTLVKWFPEHRGFCHRSGYHGLWLCCPCGRTAHALSH